MDTAHRFEGNVRSIEESDLIHIKPILETWIVDRDTGIPLPEEVADNLEQMHQSALRQSSNTFLIAESSQGNVIGVIGFRPASRRMLVYTTTKKPAELINAYVSPEHRAGKGVGRALVETLEKTAVSQGFQEMVLNSGPRYRSTAWGFYDRLPGYQRVGIAKELYGPGGDAPVWRKSLEV
jgi:ribosomal protein S18 acetylase RimI-like enzyme